MKPPYRDADELRQGTVGEFIADFREREQTGGCPPELVEIHYLMAAMDTFRMLEIWGGQKFLAEGWEPRSPQVKEIVRRLTAPENRAALRAWYIRAGRGINPSAAQFRDWLGKAIGERLGAQDRRLERQRLMSKTRA
jgi:hypothetical protein